MKRQAPLRRVCVELDRTELCAVLLALELGAAAAARELAPSTRAELARASAQLLAALVDAATSGHVQPWAVGAAAAARPAEWSGVQPVERAHRVSLNGAAKPRRRRRSSSTTAASTAAAAKQTTRPARRRVG